MFKINYGYGLSPKQYSTLKGAKIAASVWLKSSSINWVTITEFKNGSPFEHQIYRLK